MAMTRDEFVTEVRANLRRTSTALSDARIRTWLNWAQELICSWHTYEETKKNYTGSTAASDLRYGFPSRMKDIHTLTIQDGASSRKLIYVAPREFDLKVPRPEQTTEGLSSFYVDYGVNFELYRIPDAIYTLRLRCSVFAADLDTNVVSTLLRKDPLLCAMTTVIGFAALRELEDATYWKEQFVKLYFDSSLEADHSGEDWAPKARGFSAGGGGFTSRVQSYISNPLVWSMP